MKYKIVADSSTDLVPELMQNMNLEFAPLTLEVDGVRYVDDESIDIPAYLDAANSSPIGPKSACPSPDDYLSKYKGDHEGVFVVTLSSALSASYSTAVLAKDLLKEEDENMKVHVFDSRSASAGQVALTLKIQDCIDAGMAFEDIVETVEKYKDEMKTVFVLEKIDHLQKAGRLSKMKLTLANVLNIKLVLMANEEGEINLHSQARGTKKALDKMITSFKEVGTVSSDKRCVVAYCQAKERALKVCETIRELYDFKEVIAVPMKGLSSNYANVGGIVIGF